MSSPFSASRIDLQSARLGPLDPACCQSLAEAIAAIPPWSTMKYPAEAMARFLVSSADGAYRYRIDAGGDLAGAVSIRQPWLKGPYLELLAILPPFQNRGIGADILDWFEREALRAEARGTGVRTTLLSPSGVDTSLWQDIKFLGSETPPDRSNMIQASSVAGAVLFAVTQPPEVTIEELRMSRS